MSSRRADRCGKWREKVGKKSSFIPRAIKIGRKYPEWRISAYECEFDSSGISYKLGETGKPAYVLGRYGWFNEDRLQEEIIPKLSEYVEAREAQYPFLITQHRLERETTAHITSLKGVKFDPRKPATGHSWCAVVLSRTEYKLLSPSTT